MVLFCPYWNLAAVVTMNSGQYPSKIHLFYFTKQTNRQQLRNKTRNPICHANAWMLGKDANVGSAYLMKTLCTSTLLIYLYIHKNLCNYMSYEGL